MNPPVSGVVAVRLDQGFLKRLKPEALEEVGGSLPGLVQALLDGYNLVGGFRSNSYVRYHGRGVSPDLEPAFFTSTSALEEHEGTLSEPLDAWTLARWLCQRPPRNRFEPGFLLLYFNPERTCTQVRIPTAADSENPDFRPSPASERVSGSSSANECGRPLAAAK